MRPVIIAIAVIFVLSACSKKDKTAADILPPAIFSLNPVNNQVFTGGQTVNIASHITDANKIATVHVHISDNTTGQLLIDIHRYPNAVNYDLSESFIAQAGIQYKIQVVAIDVSANEGYLTLFVSAN